IRSRSEDWPALSMLVPTLGAVEVPTQSAKDVLSDLAFASADPNIGSKVQLSLDVVAHNLGKTDREQSRCQTDIPTQPDSSLPFDQPTVEARRGTKVRVRLSINRIGGFTGDLMLTPPRTEMGIKPTPSTTITTVEMSAKFKLKIAVSASIGEH